MKNKKTSWPLWVILVDKLLINDFTAFIEVVGVGLGLLIVIPAAANMGNPGTLRIMLMVGIPVLVLILLHYVGIAQQRYLERHGILM